MCCDRHGGDDSTIHSSARPADDDKSCASVLPCDDSQRATQRRCTDRAGAGPEKDPVGNGYSTGTPTKLEYHVIAADRLSPGYARKVVDAIIQKMDTPPVMMH